MATKRRQHSGEFKAKVAVAALKSDKTVNEIASQFQVHPMPVSQWKKQALEGLPEWLGDRRRGRDKDGQALIDSLYQQIGQQKVELDWLKKNLACSAAERRALLDPDHDTLSLRRQCQLLGVARASVYYEPSGENEENLRLMRLLDEQYTRTPFYGVRRMTAWLETEGYYVDVKRVRRLLRFMGLEAIYPKPQLSQRNPEHTIYPYLLRGVAIDRVNQVWSTDITYVPLAQGWAYLVAVIDWYSRYVLSWEISNTLEAGFCCEALERALQRKRQSKAVLDCGS